MSNQGAELIRLAEKRRYIVRYSEKKVSGPGGMQLKN
jgi:hypothetical protein